MGRDGTCQAGGGIKDHGSIAKAAVLVLNQDMIGGNGTFFFNGPFRRRW